MVLRLDDEGEDANKRFDIDGQADYGYELPEKGGFDDEDIDSDEVTLSLAFTISLFVSLFSVV